MYPKSVQQCKCTTFGCSTAPVGPNQYIHIFDTLEVLTSQVTHRVCTDADHVPHLRPYIVLWGGTSVVILALRRITCFVIF